MSNAKFLMKTLILYLTMLLSIGFYIAGACLFRQLLEKPTLQIAGSTVAMICAARLLMEDAKRIKLNK